MKILGIARYLLAPAIAVVLFFCLVLSVYNIAGSDMPEKHSNYDSYTLQALAWRDGRVSLDKNYPWLELAIVNDEYFSTHDKDDYMSYREVFGDVGVVIEHQEGNEYYVSFPPVPSVPMFFLSFIYGEETPSCMAGIIYAAGALFFSILMCKRLGYSDLVSVCGGAFVSIASSAFFLCTNKSGGGVWFQAQLLSLFLTAAAFYCILGKRDRDHYAAFALLALAVGCRPFQLLYYFFFAYLAAKKYDFKILKTWKFYIAPAVIGGCFMIYNYVRFGDVFEFGHNYLPEFMRMPDGQFGIAYLKKNFENMFKEVPELTAEGISYGRFGFAFWAANVLFIVVAAGIIFYAFHLYYKRSRPAPVKKSRLKKAAAEKVSIGRFLVDIQLPEAAVLTVLIGAHILLFLLHKTLGGWQFGSRYTADILPAALMLAGIVFKPLFSKDEKEPAYDRVCAPVAAVILVILTVGCVFNIYGSLLMFG